MKYIHYIQELYILKEWNKGHLKQLHIVQDENFKYSLYCSIDFAFNIDDVDDLIQAIIDISERHVYEKVLTSCKIIIVNNAFGRLIDIIHINMDSSARVSIYSEHKQYYVKTI